MTETNGVSAIEGDQPPQDEVAASGDDSQVVENGVSDHVNSIEKKHSSSSSKDKHHSSSSSKDKHRSSSSSKHHSSSSSKDKHYGSSSKHHSSSSSKDKHHSSSGSSKDKHHSSSSSKHGSSSHKHSSSSSKDKHHSSSSKDKHHSSSSSSKDKHHSSSSSKDKHHSSSSSSKDKHRSSGSSKDHHSSSKDKHHSSSSKHSSSRDKHGSSKDKHHSSSSKHKDSHSKPVEVKPEIQNDAEMDFVDSMSPKLEASPTPVQPEEYPVDVKVEPETPVKVEKEEPMESDDDVPLTSRRAKAEVNYSDKMEEDSDEEPLSSRMEKKNHVKEEPADSDDDEPLSARMNKKAKKPTKKRKAEPEDEEDTTPVKKKKKTAVKQEAAASPTKKAKAAAEAEAGKWKWWEEKKADDGTKWKFLEHKGPLFAPEYEPLPPDVKFFYDGKPMKLSPETEEVATFYGRMLDHDYTTKETFNKNFMKDWRSVMTREEKEIITDLSKCNFKQILVHFKDQSERRKAASKEEKLKIKEQNAALQAEYGFCAMDGHQEKIGNFRIEPPGLFRGRGSHPKMGMLKKRTMPENVIINCSKGAKVPDPPEGHRWKEVRHDNSVTWLACWVENVQGQTKYVMLNPASKLKGEKDWAKYEVARNLHKTVDKIRANYYDDFKSKEMRIRQRAVAMYFIDKLALRAGNEKDEDTADTVGCCSLRVEHLTLHEEMEGKPFVVEFDFLGKDSIRYYNKVAVEKRVFKNLQLFMDNKNDGDDLFDRLNTAVLNKHLQGLMDGLTAKVFRTYNASKTLQEQLDLLTNPDDNVPSKLLSYNRANRKVAILCNHQRAAPKNFEKQMENLQVKIDAKKQQVKEAKKQLKEAKADYKASKNDRNKSALEKKKKAVERVEMALTKLEVAATDKDENKEIALGTSKLNYLDPRISVAWCKKWEVPIEKIYNKTQRDKFAWAIDMAEEDFKF